jgi:hypothetical protein
VKRRVLAAAFAASIVLACGHPAEESLLARFFNASRLRDKTVLQTISTVAFEPNEQGIVTRFEIVNVTPEEVNGTVASKSVTVSAPVQLPDGTTAIKTLFLTMQRREGNPWMITGITVSGAAAPSPPPR